MKKSKKERIELASNKSRLKQKHIVGKKVRKKSRDKGCVADCYFKFDKSRLKQKHIVGKKVRKKSRDKGCVADCYFKFDKSVERTLTFPRSEKCICEIVCIIT